MFGPPVRAAGRVNTEDNRVFKMQNSNQMLQVAAFWRFAECRLLAEPRTAEPPIF